MVEIVLYGRVSFVWYSSYSVVELVLYGTVRIVW